MPKDTPPWTNWGYSSESTWKCVYYVGHRDNNLEQSVRSRPNKGYASPNKIIWGVRRGSQEGPKIMRLEPDILFKTLQTTGQATDRVTKQAAERPSAAWPTERAKVKVTNSTSTHLSVQFTRAFLFFDVLRAIFPFGFNLNLILRETSSKFFFSTRILINTKQIDVFRALKSIIMHVCPHTTLTLC